MPVFRGVLSTIDLALGILSSLIFVWAIMSWFIFFTYQSSFRWRHRRFYNVIQQIYDILSRTFAPILRPFRRILPPHKTGGVDWSPMLLFLAIYFLRYVLRASFAY